MLYDSIQQSGLQSAELFYNIGNAYYKLQDWPHCILYYEKALKLDANNEDALHNLELVQLKIVDKIESIPPLFFEKWITSIISFLKPGIIKIFSKNNEEKFYVEDGIVEFKDNSLSILTSSIFGLDKIDKDYVSQSIQNAEKELLDKNVEDQKRFLISQKIDVLKSISSN